MSEYKSVWFIVPSFITDYDDLNFAHLKVFQTIYEFFNHNKPCFLGNEEIMRRTKIKSDGTIRKAIIYFEKKGVLKKTIGADGRRYLEYIQPKIEIEAQKNKKESKKAVDKPSKGRSHRNATPFPQERDPVPTGTYKKKKLNKEVNKTVTDDFLKKEIDDKFYPNYQNQKLADHTAQKCNTTGQYLLKRFIDVTKKAGRKEHDFNELFAIFLEMQKPAKPSWSAPSQVANYLN